MNMKGAVKCNCK